MGQRFFSNRSVSSSLVVTAATLLGGFLFVIPSAHASAVPLLDIPSLASDTSLVSYYPFEGNLNDVAGGNTAIATSTSYSSTTPSSAFGDSLYFNGSNSSAEQQSNSGITGFDAFTINAWIYSATTTISPQDIASLGTENTYNDGGAFIIQYTNPNEIGYFIAGGAGHIVTTDSPITLNTWHMVTMTYPAGTGIGSTTIYIDGQEDPNVSIGGSSDVPSLSNYPMDMGRELTQTQGGGVWPLLGNLDGVSLFSRVLSPTEVSDLYNGTGGFYAQIENTPAGRWLLRSSPATSTDSNFIERLPQDWVVYVSSTADATTSGGYNWYDVVDPTDGVEGWMAASSSGTTYLQYSTNTDQGTLEAMAATTTDLVNSTTVYDAIDWYYNNTSTTNSLYSSDNGDNDLSFFGSGTTTTFNGNSYSIFPEQVILGIAAQEDGKDGYNFNNQNVSYDYGSGVMQLTSYQVWADEPTSTGNWIYNADMPSTYGGSFIDIYPCAMSSTYTYVNCYANGGEGVSSTAESYIHYGNNSSNPTYMYYANTAQSIYANIKDGMKTLQDKYGAFSPITTSTITGTSSYTGQEREVIFATSLYNGSGTAACNYVAAVASDTINLDNYFPGVATDTISDPNLLTNMYIAGTNVVCAQLHSPATLAIQDSSGRTIGIVNGKGENDFPLAIYDSNGKWAKIFAAGTGDYTFKVTGTGSSTYGFDITIVHGSQNIIFSTRNMPVIPGQIDTYTVDPDAVLAGENGITLQVDTKGDGTIDKTETFGASVMNNEQENASTITIQNGRSSTTKFIDPVLVFLGKISPPQAPKIPINNYIPTIPPSTSTIIDTTTLEIYKLTNNQ